MANRKLVRPWLPNEEAELLSLFGAGATAEQAGDRLGRTPNRFMPAYFQKQRGRTSRKSGQSFAQLPNE